MADNSTHQYTAPQPRSKNKQLAINMISQVGVFVISYGITFLLSPYIVRSLGIEAYGFVGLSNTIISYLQIATIALNSMAGRFITIEYHRGDFQKAKEYFSSVFYSNVFLSLIIAIISMGLVVYLEYVISVPNHLLLDVKWLFVLITANSLINLIFNVYTVSPFIANRIEITATRNLVSKIIYAGVIVGLFYCFSAKLYYLGIASILSSIYLVYANYRIKNEITPELEISYSNFKLDSVWELTKSGIWNLITKLGDLLQRGFDLLFANWFINAVAMGVLSITTQVPFIILSVLSMLSASFAPSMTKDFALNDMEAIKSELTKSVRILSIMIIIPISALYVYGDIFYKLWLPGQDAELLQQLTICGTFALLVTSPLDGFWNVFTITNRIKGASMFMLFNSICVFITVIILIQATDNLIYRMFIIAGTRSAWGVFRGLIFLPLYSANCLGLKKTYFYPMLVKPIIGISITLALMYLIRLAYVPETWIGLFIAFAIVAILSLLVGSQLVLTPVERKIIISRVHDKIKK